MWLMLLCDLRSAIDGASNLCSQICQCLGVDGCDEREFLVCKKKWLAQKSIYQSLGRLTQQCLSKWLIDHGCGKHTIEAVGAHISSGNLYLGWSEDIKCDHIF
jgi:hypothetical protein